MNLRDEGLPEDLVKDLMTQVKCHYCGKHFTKEDIRVIGHEDNIWFLKVSCQTCGRACLMLALISEIDNPEMTNDLSGTKRRKSRYYEIPTTDDVLDMHCFLKNFDGDFARLFRGSSRIDK